MADLVQTTFTVTLRHKDTYNGDMVVKPMRDGIISQLTTYFSESEWMVVINESAGP